MKNNSKLENRKLYLFMITIIFIIFITKVCRVNINSLLIDAIYLLFLLFSSKNNLMYSLIFTLPLASCFENVAHIWLIYLMFIFIKNDKHTLRFYVFLFVFIVLELLAHYYYGISDLNRMVGYITSFSIFVYLIVDLPKEKLKIDFSLRIYIISTFILLLTYLLSIISMYGSSSLSILMNNRFGIADEYIFANLPISLNANTIAYYCIVAFFLFIVLLRNNNKMKHHFVYVIITLIILILGFLTRSRSYIIIILMGIFLLVMTNLNTKKQILYSFIFLICFSIIITLILKSNSVIINDILSRFNEKNVASGNGRLDILNYYNKVFFSNFKYMVMGSGVTDYYKVYNIPVSTHNGIQQALVCYGLIGFVFFINLLFKPINYGLKNKIKLIYYIPFIISFMFIQTVQLLNPYMLMFPLAISYLTLYLKNEGEKI